MANLPIYLQPGLVAIYGSGSATGISGIQAGNVALKFGVVHQVWNYGNLNANVGDSVMWNNNDKICEIRYLNWPYTIIEEAKLVLTEIVLP